jgi:hypothetical protein
MKYWGYNDYQDYPERCESIINEVQGDNEIVELACGSGQVISKLKELTNAHCIGVDIQEHPFWKESKAEMIKEDIMDFIKRKGQYDTIIMLNSFRNWNMPEKTEFENWLKGHAKKFITSTDIRYKKKVIGKDTYDLDLELYYLDKLKD